MKSQNTHKRFAVALFCFKETLKLQVSHNTDALHILKIQEEGEAVSTWKGTARHTWQLSALLKWYTSHVWPTGYRLRSGTSLRHAISPLAFKSPWPFWKEDFEVIERNLFSQVFLWYKVNKSHQRGQADGHCISMSMDALLPRSWHPPLHYTCQISSKSYCPCFTPDFWP